MAEPNVHAAEQIKNVLAQYPMPEEAKEALLAEAHKLERPPSNEILPPNIPVNPQALREQMLADDRTAPLAEAVPPGHPGVDYQDGDEAVPHQSGQTPTSQGRQIPEFLNVG